MAEFKLKNFGGLLREVKAIRGELSKDQEKGGRDKRFERIAGIATLVIAVLSFGISIYTIWDNNETDERNFKNLQSNQAYDFWLNYLTLASEHPRLANGLKCIGDVPVGVLACRKKNDPESEVEKGFVNYAWFVARTLGTVEVVADLTDNDPAWVATIDEIIMNHISYLSSDCFQDEQYGPYVRKRIKILKSKAQLSHGCDP